MAVRSGDLFLFVNASDRNERFTPAAKQHNEHSEFAMYAKCVKTFWLDSPEVGLKGTVLRSKCRHRAVSHLQVAVVSRIGKLAWCGG